MEFNIKFSCDETIFDLTKWENEISDTTIEHNDRCNMFSLEFENSVIENADYVIKSARLDRNNNVHIPASVNNSITGYVDASNRDRKIQLFPHFPFNNFTITEISFSAWEYGEQYHEYSNERELVLDLMLGRITGATPFTEKWINFYDKHKELTTDYMAKHNKQAEDFMTAIINEEVKFIKINEVTSDVAV